MREYQHFRVLLDEPTERPVLGFDTYAGAFADLILRSKPQFAIGIFGEWGSGKTTLMQAIDRDLGRRGRGKVIPVRFNAWRYEREQHLVVPLLDTLREALVAWAEANPDPADATVAAGARRAAATIGRAARALLAGLTLRGGVPFTGLEAEVDLGKVVDGVDAERRMAEQPLSFYHTSFRAMQQAIEPFVDGGKRRIVVFVDDLDRCLPLNALQVLESIKLLFDEPGFVFVVGLDREVIERSVELRYRGPGAAATDGNPGVRGTDYIKKIFQVPFTLPRVRTDQIGEYFTALVKHTGLPRSQRQHLTEVVEPHLNAITGDREVNPREIKRLLNAYVLQLKMLGPKFDLTPVYTFEPQVVLALQAMTFRADWSHLYDALVADPRLFVESLRSRVNDAAVADDGGLWLGDEETPVPPSFLTYLRGNGATLLRDDLEIYVSSIESTRSTDFGVVSMQRAVGRLRAATQQVLAADLQASSTVSSELLTYLEELERELSSGTGSGVAGAAATMARVQDLRQEMQRLSTPFASEEERQAWAGRVTDHLSRIQAYLAELRRHDTVGPTAS